VVKGIGFSSNGIAPDVYSKNSESDIQAKNDLVLEESIQFLFDQYGIE
jgi:hypothetical protein